MRLVIFLMLILISNVISAQEIFNLVKTSDYKAVKKYKKSINVGDVNEATPLMWAMHSSDIKMVKLLISKGASPYIKGRIIWRNKYGLQSHYGSCLVVAAGENKIDILKYLLQKHKISLDDKEINQKTNIENGRNALQWASANGHYEIVEYLVNKGANPNAYEQYDDTPLHLAVFGYHIDIVKLLVKSGADINKLNMLDETPFILAFDTHEKDEGKCETRKDIIKFLIKSGADINKGGSNGDTPLHDELYFGDMDIEIIRILLESGADINKRNSSGETPLNNALYSGGIELIRFMVEAGANVNNLDSENQTPLYQAVILEKDKEIIKYLYSRGARFNKTNEEKMQKKLLDLFKINSIEKL